MSSHPLNLAWRFILELLALAAMGSWGWTQHESPARWLWAVGLPLVAAAAWGTFAVPADPSRSGNAPVPIPGILRLFLELTFFGLASYLLWTTQHPLQASLLAIMVVIHYLISYDRIKWLLRQ